MRRLSAVPILVALSVMLVTPVSAQGPPTKIRLEPTVVPPEIFAGTCPFDVGLVDTFASSNGFFFPPDAAGNERQVFNGGFRSTITNLDDDISREISYFGRIEFTFRTDGTVDIHTSGTVLFWTTAEDVHSNIGQGIWLITGSVRATLDADTFFALEPGETVRGRLVNLCDVLSPQPG